MPLFPSSLYLPKWTQGKLLTEERFKVISSEQTVCTASLRFELQPPAEQKGWGASKANIFFWLTFFFFRKLRPFLLPRNTPTVACQCNLILNSYFSRSPAPTGLAIVRLLRVRYAFRKDSTTLLPPLQALSLRSIYSFQEPAVLGAASFFLGLFSPGDTRN